MSLKSEAVELDALAAELSARMSSDFIRIGKVMDAMTDENQRWRLLDDPRTGKPYASQEDWVKVRFRSQRATAFEARRVYRVLHNNVPDDVLESAEPGSLKIMAQLPISAQRDPVVHLMASEYSAGEFTEVALKNYPQELIEKRVTWSLKPTISQYSFYNNIMEKIQKAYADIGEVVSREDALEALFAEWDSNH